ncbi:7,8-didemethyl-8-hydroxy-5-deazariboflavin synthase CofG [Rathayibacter toxicus]|uniref:7,8-didemethyl-8-hydroxy-5-deazariboflavin synthase n=1 Tax=Rathayibacter toxicus TaxID=145458 RepID=A0A2S5Y949_9MICO|nr:7,8-didemethyl-8-hydroxy-5-deazariboflavin synthase CofG [Rathayibacter toxicus]PPG23268.1 7,8-didemethyl-8-hydroxy-5-deazariboflavin synthase subunit CofG [Rathayibacter toxicus]PPG47851.1 7,8-didemethyl-8-hydroxy-5-deazariboflavin synthase subunit CofG [Rathayibacter toxicus]PPH24994.1 7,8-didemethyl-8-hydroxy-5-deazariboflavin synthase subunit CofG [Rathayibacter toxicus]PPH58920.1 7,8-didemethyl-8-hydroxy-5-deazariboflavin synthase subunit CofG [Rathayibacter toxicus]PPH60914.1 7,8-dide
MTTATVLTRLDRGEPLTRDSAALLLEARGCELDALLEAAGRLRDEGLARRGRPGIVTYSRKVFLPLTKLCRDRCHYCVFVETPGGLAAHGTQTFMTAEEILDVAHAGAKLGCKEALFTLGDRPEDRWPTARTWLAEHGYTSTLDYLRAMAVLVLRETGLVAHLNPGVMSWAELQRLRPVAPSMGMMLETTATRLWSEKGGVHYGSPDKDPTLRLRVLEDAGRSRIPFTTGVLLGIGETVTERADALFAIRDSHARWGHLQECIVQNFRAKPRTAMHKKADLELQEYIASVAVARLVLGAQTSIQAPPNLTDEQELDLLIRAGIDDWGGVSPLTADHVNPERPWPNIDDLARVTASCGYRLHERLTAHPHYVKKAATWLDPRIAPHVLALADPVTGLADETATVLPRVYRETLDTPHRPAAPTLATVLARATADPAGLDDSDYLELLSADGDDLEALAALADEVRRETVGDTVSTVSNRNIDTSRWGAGGLTVERLEELADEAAALGATELCLQGALAPERPGDDLLLIARTLKARQPLLHLHAFRPAEIRDAAQRSGRSITGMLIALRDAGVDTIPGTAARILDDRVRTILSQGSDPSAAEWRETIIAAHRIGLRSSATMVYGHLETPEQQLAHLRALAVIQEETQGFTEFIAMPFLAAEASPTVARLTRGGPTLRETRAVHAVARLLLHGRISHIQTAWTKLGTQTAQVLLCGGADDLGGLLLDGTLEPEAGAEAYRSLDIATVARLTREIGRSWRQRNTVYEPVPLERALSVTETEPVTALQYRPSPDEPHRVS